MKEPWSGRAGDGGSSGEASREGEDGLGDTGEKCPEERKAEDEIADHGL